MRKQIPHMKPSIKTKSYNKETALERSVGKLLVGLNQFNLRKKSSLIHLQITNICPVRIGVF